MIVDKVMEDLSISKLLESIYGNYVAMLQDLIFYMIITEGQLMQYF